MLSDPRTRSFRAVSSLGKNSRAPSELLQRARHVHFDGDLAQRSDPGSRSNAVRTTKYTMFTFTHRFLFEQFRKKANVYFLIAGLLATIRSISPTKPEATLAPLAAIMLLSAIKELWEDSKRSQMDRLDNETKVRRWNGFQFEDIASQDVREGDAVMVKADEAFPADLFLLQSSQSAGSCKIQTSNLDGETNLKVKKAVAKTFQSQCKEDGSDYCTHLTVELDCTMPNERLDEASWFGSLTSFDGPIDPVPVGMDQLLMKGCTLRQTDWIIAVVVFIGHETKLSLNSKEVPLKRSRVEQIVDHALYMVMGILATMCFIITVMAALWMKKYGEDHGYLKLAMSTSATFELFKNFLTCFILLNGLVPISLYVAIEVVKTGQAMRISSDPNMYNSEKKQNAKARTSNLNEELGQIEYVFTDKTGTLTRNKMELLNVFIGGVAYGPGEMQRAGKSVHPIERHSSLPPTDSNFRLEDPRLLHHLKHGSENSVEIDRFLTMLSVCHTAAPQLNEAGDGVTYHAASPDEFALVQAAKNLHYFCMKREVAPIIVGEETIDGEICTVNIGGDLVDFEILNVLEFNSDRKRMSVVIRDGRDSKIYVLCKGADNVIAERLLQSSMKKDWNVAERQLMEYASDGLRTLCFAYKTLEEDEYLAWHRSLNDALNHFNDRDFHVDAVFEELENGLELIGCSAIEDQLQEGVPDTIESLTKANMKVWMLTGDKLETAINVGRSCRLISSDHSQASSNLIVIDVDEKLRHRAARKETRICLEQAWSMLKTMPDDVEGVGVVVSGKALGCLFPAKVRDNRGREIKTSPKDRRREHYLQMEFLKICSRVNAVICCRVSPAQKAQVITLVKENKSAITCSIGDGANDVPMIQAAHVGIGIFGAEGLQAVRASDYAIAEFRFLKELLLVHGMMNYRRISLLINYSFYKNALITFFAFFFSWFNGFSGQEFFECYTTIAFNLVFVAFPICVAGVYNCDVSEASARLLPRLYRGGQRNEQFNMRHLAFWLCRGVFHALVLFLLTVLTLGDSVDMFGHSQGLWQMSSTVYIAMVLVVSIVMILETSTWVPSMHFWMWGSLLSLPVYFAVFTNLTFSEEVYGLALPLLQSGPGWMFIPLAVMMCIVPEMALRHVQDELWPTDVRLVREAEKHKCAGLFEERHLERERCNTLTLVDMSHDEPSVGGSPARASLERRGGQAHLGYAPFQAASHGSELQSHRHRTFSSRDPSARQRALTIMRWALKARKARPFSRQRRVSFA